MPSHLLVLDIGTSSVRASLYDAVTCEMIDISRRSTLDWSKNDRVDPEKWRTRAVEPAIEELLRNHGEAEVIKIGFACFSMSLIGVDWEGMPVTKLYSYATPFTSAPIATFETPSQPTLARLGVSSPFHASYAYVHIDQIARESPATFSRIAQFVSLPSYLASRWCDVKRKMPISFSEASWWGMFDSVDLKWCVVLFLFIIDRCSTQSS